MQQQPNDPNNPYPQQQAGGYAQSPVPYQNLAYQNPAQGSYMTDPGYGEVPTTGETIALIEEGSMETLSQKLANRNKAISLGISMGIIALLFALLAWWTIVVLNEENIELIVSASQGEQNAVVEKKQFQQSVRQKPSRPSSSPSNVISANKTSPVSVPSIANIDSPDLGSSFGNGFGGGGFGDGLGGGMGVPSVMRGRCNSADRISRMRKAGGKAAMDRQVLQALRWIKGQQQQDGHFGTGKYPVAMTAFALLAFCGHCETVDSPEFGQNVKAAIEFLINVAERNKGYMMSSNDRTMSYEHGIAVYALGEAYSLNKNARKPFKRISPTLKNAVPIIIEGQTNGGGWLYSYGAGGTGDLSVAGWQIQALKAAEFTGLKFSGLTTAKKKAVRYLEAAEDPNGTDGFYRYRVNDGQKGKLSLTGVGTVCARMLGSPSKLEDKSLDLIISRKPGGYAGANLYSWYYHSQAAFQKQGKHWRDYNDSYQMVVAKAQQQDGSWPAGGGHANSTGADAQLYSTCLCTLMLEVYYRYLPGTK